MYLEANLAFMQCEIIRRLLPGSGIAGLRNSTFLDNETLTKHNIIIILMGRSAL